MQLVRQAALIIIIALSKVRKSFFYLSHGLRGTTERRCGNDTHCSPSVISPFQRLIRHLDNTVCHLQKQKTGYIRKTP